MISDRLLRLARPFVFLLGVTLSLLAVYSYAYTAWRVIVDPALISPDADLWTAVQLEQALAGLGLPGNFYALYTLAITLLFGFSFLVCGWLIFLNRSHDWFGIYLSLLLLTWASGVGVFSSIPIVPWLDNSYISWFMWPGIFLLLYFFPSGHIVPHWTRWFAWVWIFFCAYMLVADILGRLPENFLIFLPVHFSIVLVGGSDQVYRYRHAAVGERQQIKLVVFSLVLFATFFVFFALAINFTGLTDPGERGPVSALVFSIILSAGANLIFMGIPISIAVAMLRYRLWDIDVIIRRTLIYGVLTATLAIVFFGGVALLQQAFGTLTGTESSPVAIVISTLVIVALFNPLRKRVQDFIDRRFYRRKYDAQQILEQFAIIALNETDLDVLTTELVRFAQETMQPERVSLWLKEGKK